ncbi:MAG: hypothetical protein WCB49_12840 [Gammaproteobacteria bacterium]
MDRRLQSLANQVARVEEAPYDEQFFCDLSGKAAELYERYPALGEQIAYLMSGVWALSHEGWSEGSAEHLGQLFADLEVPPYHVQGGEAGAKAKWAMIRELVKESKKSGGKTPPDSKPDETAD